MKNYTHRTKNDLRASAPITLENVLGKTVYNKTGEMFTPEIEPFLKSTRSCIKIHILIVLTVYDGIKYYKI